MPTVKFRSTGGGVKLTAVLPKPLQVKRMEAVILKDMQKMAREMKKDFAKTTRTWDTDVQFQYRTEPPAKPMDGRAKVDIQVGPKPNTKGAEIYGYVDGGTRPHTIQPKRPGGVLSFMWGGPGSYRPKTSPRLLSSTAGGPTGSMVAFKRVHHPGTKARKFTETIARRWGQLSRRYATKTMTGVVLASGHSMKGR